MALWIYHKYGYQFWIWRRRHRLYSIWNEISEEYLDIDGNVGNNFETENIVKKDYSANFDHSVEFNVGDHVLHDTFGSGIIVKVDKSVISIAFPHPVGIKTFMKGHKSIRKVWNKWDLYKH